MAKYGAAASKSVKSAVKRTKSGTLKSGSGRKVTSRKQAIAIGLNEAREKGAKVPAPRTGRKKTSSTKRASATGARKTAARKTGARKTAARKTAARKTGGRKKGGATGRKSTRS